MACAALRSSLDLVLVCDVGGRVRLASESCTSLLGYTPDELQGMSAPQLFAPSWRGRLDALLLDRARPGPRTETLDALGKDGGALPVALTVSAFVMPDGEEFVCLVLRDDSARHRVEQDLAERRRQLEDLVRVRTEELERSHQQLRISDRLAGIGALAAGLGHDMNNVLLPVRARLNALLSAGLSETAREHVEAVRRSIGYLQQLADSLHALAMDPTRGDGPASTRLALWWSQTGPLLSKAAPDHVHVEARFPESLAAVAIAPHRLTQSVLNLLVNAGQAISPRRRRRGVVRVWAEPGAEAGTVRIAVQDNGEGMSAAVRDRAFEMFYTTRPGGLGTGLGLPLVRRVVEDAGGAVELRSRVGRGTTVVLTLPTAQPLSPEEPEPPRERTAALTLADARTASLVEQLLRAEGIPATRQPEPGGADLWITDRGPAAVEEAAAWRGEDGGRVLVLAGWDGPAPEGGWVVTIQDPHDLFAVRHALGRALAGP